MSDVFLMLFPLLAGPGLLWLGIRGFDTATSWSVR